MVGLRQSPAFLVVCLAQAASLLGSGVLVLAILLAVFDGTGSGTATTLVFLAETAPMAALSLWAGALADRVDRRRLIVGADLVRAGLLVPLLFGDPVDHLPVLCAVLCAQAAVGAVFRPAFAGLLPRTVPPELLPSANAAWATAGGVVGVLAPVLGAAAYATGGLRLVVLVDIASFLLSAALMSVVRIATAPTASPAGEERPTTRSAIRLVRSSGLLKRFFLVATTFGVADAVLYPVLVPFLRGNLSAGTAEVGALFTTLSVATLLAAPLSAPLMQRFGVRRLYCAGAVGTTAGLLALGLSPTVGVAAVALLLTGVPSALFGIAQTTMLQQASPDRELGRVFGVLGALISLVKLTAAGAPLVLLPLLGVRGTLLFAVGACCVGCVLVLRDRSHTALTASGRTTPAAPAEPAACSTVGSA